MGAGDYISDKGSQYWSKPETITQDLSKLDVVGNSLGLAHFGDARNYADGRPGIVTGAPPPIQSMRRNPDGTFTDPATGQTYSMGPNGAVPIMNPNVAQQVGAATGQAAAYTGAAQGYDAREQAAFDRQGALADHLNQVAQGNGPTVAGTQLAIGQEQAAQQQLAQAAGASGNGAMLTRLAAMNNTAQLQAQTNQQQAMARAQEAATANGQLAAVTGNMTQTSGNMAGQKIGAAEGLNKLAMSGQGDLEESQAKTEAANSEKDQARKDKWTNMFSDGLGKMLSF